jgi:soluble lytic murein transglycosylase
MVIVVLAIVALSVWRGPVFYRFFTHPLDYQDSIAAAARAERVDPYLVAAVINVESGFRANATSPAGAIGLMQLLPKTATAVAAHLGLAKRMDATTLKVPADNIRVGTAYLGELLRQYKGDERLALAAYNAGMSNAERWAVGWDFKATDAQAVKHIDFPETVNYVGEVLAQVAVYRSLYPTAFASPQK